MSYKQALEAAGANVLAYERFGSYRGDWLAKVTYKDETFYVAGEYGSCSGCDSFEAKFECGGAECEEHRYEGSKEDCAGCLAAREDYQTRLVDFGLSYLTDPRNKADLFKKFTEDSEWDGGAQESIDWLNEN
jgi:hypothetical protein